jgi:hypothetical protein
MAKVLVINGTERLREVVRKLREAGDKDVVNAMVRGIREAAKPTVADVQEKVRHLPIHGEREFGGLRGGALARFRHDVSRSKAKNVARTITRAIGRSGLRETVARSITITVSTSPRRAAVRIKAAAARMPPDQRRLPRRLNRGKWRHPVFGNKENWVTQTSEPNWFDGTIKKHAPEVRREIKAQVDEVMRKI